MKYLELRAAIIDWTEENGAELAAHIDDFIRAAELRIFREVDLQIFHGHVTSQITAGDPYITMPTGSDIIVREFYLVDQDGRYIILLRKHNSFLYDFWPDPSQTGRPRYYSRWLYNVLLVAPTPDYPYNLEMEVSQLPVSIVPTVAGSDNSSWLGDNAWDAMLAAAILEALAFMKKDAPAMTGGAGQPAGLWGQKYQEAITRLGVQEKRERMDDFRATDAK